MKKSKLLSILAVVLCFAMVLPSCKLHKIQPTTEPKEEETEEKKTEPTETSASMLVHSMDQYISDGLMYAEEDATTTTSETVAKETLLSPERTSSIDYTAGDMSFSVTSEWDYLEDSENGMQDFFIDMGSRRSVMMVYKSDDNIPLGADTFQEYSEEFGTAFLNNLENGKVVSNVVHTDGSIYYADVYFDGVYTSYNSTDMYIYFRILEVPNTTTLYAVGLLVDKNDADIMDTIMSHYQDTLVSVEISGMDLYSDQYTEHTIGGMSFNVPSDWYEISEDGSLAYVPNITEADSVLMIFTSESSYSNGLTAQNFSTLVDSMNEGFVGGLVNGTIQQSDVYGDGMPQYADVIYEGVSNETENVYYARFYADSHGVGYFFILQMEKSMDETKKAGILEIYRKIIKNAVFEV